MYRRNFLNKAAIGLGGCLMTSAAGQIAFAYPSTNRASPTRPFQAKVNTRNTAKNLVFVLLDGGASHVDTFDLKLARETPTLLGALNLGGFQWPAGIMPKLATMANKFSLVRSLSAVEVVHERAVYHLTTAHRHDSALVGEIPHFASAMAYKLQSQRRPQDSLPQVVLFGEAAAKNGFFPIEHRGLELSGEGQVPFLRHAFPGQEADARFRMLNDVLPQFGAIKDERDSRLRIQKLARAMMNDQDLLSLLGTPLNEDEIDEGAEAQAFLRQCETVVRLLNADKGTRIAQLQLSGWDHHEGIYGANALPALATALDEGLAYLISTLDGIPGKKGSGTLLDETLIVVAGEFGRTTNGLNESGGRDHYPYVMSALIAGGGTKGGRIIGSSDPTGSFIVDSGWSQRRYMGIGDLAATMYSAMGIDWTEQFLETPSGRPFSLIPTIRSGEVFEIDGLFA